jgi:hypothetical protein
MVLAQVGSSDMIRSNDASVTLKAQTTSDGAASDCMRAVIFGSPVLSCSADCLAYHTPMIDQIAK